jgi:hypothetical protein
MLPLGHLAVQVFVLPEQRVRESLAREMACGIAPIRLLHVRDQTAVTNVAFWRDGRPQGNTAPGYHRTCSGPDNQLEEITSIHLDGSAGL